MSYKTSSVSGITCNLIDMATNSFDDLCLKFSNLVCVSSNSGKKELHSLLDELNELDFRYPMVKNVTVRLSVCITLNSILYQIFAEGCSAC